MALAKRGPYFLFVVIRLGVGLWSQHFFLGSATTLSHPNYFGNGGPKLPFLVFCPYLGNEKRYRLADFTVRKSGIVSTLSLFGVSRTSGKGRKKMLKCLTPIKRSSNRPAWILLSKKYLLLVTANTILLFQNNTR